MRKRPPQEGLDHACRSHARACGRHCGGCPRASGSGRGSACGARGDPHRHAFRGGKDRAAAGGRAGDLCGRGPSGDKSVTDPSTLTLTEVAAAIRARKLSSVEVTRSLLARIERWQPLLNAFVRVEAEEALAAAAAAD